MLLDLDDENYRVLDGVASAMWRAITGEAAWPEVRAALDRTYGVGPARLDADFAAFVADLRATGVLGDAAMPDAAPPADDDRLVRALPAPLGAVHALHATAFGLRRRGFRATYRHYAGLRRGTSRDPAAALAAFGWGEHLFVARRAPEDCLVRSLALFRHLCARGVAADHVIGVCRLPFFAHAWVEVDGVPVLDGMARTGGLTPIARLGGS